MYPLDGDVIEGNYSVILVNLLIALSFILSFIYIASTKIKELFLNSIYSDIFYDHRDLKKIGLNVSTKSTENFEENYSLFLKLK